MWTSLKNESLPWLIQGLSIYTHKHAKVVAFFFFFRFSRRPLDETWVPLKKKKKNRKNLCLAKRPSESGEWPDAVFYSVPSSFLRHLMCVVIILYVSTECLSARAHTRTSFLCIFLSLFFTDDHYKIHTLQGFPDWSSVTARFFLFCFSKSLSFLTWRHLVLNGRIG